MAGDRDRRARPDQRADRLGQDARRIPLGARPASRAAARAAREPAHGLLYVSPLKALSYDVERNLRAPLRGIGARRSRVAIRTGDTPARERAAMLRNAPDILITTPESLYLMLTSRAREISRRRRGGDRRRDPRGRRDQARRASGADARAARGAAGRPPAAADRPLGDPATRSRRSARFMVGPAPQATIVDTGVTRPLDLKIRVPVESMVEPDARPAARPARPVAGGEATRRSIWPAIYPELLELVRAHRSTIVFVNSRRAAERLALRLNELAGDDAGARRGGAAEIARAHHGSLAREERTTIEELLKAGELPCLVATSSLELGIDMGAVDLVIQVESPKSVARGLQRIGALGPRRRRRQQGPDLPEVPRRPARVRGRRPPHARGRDRADGRAAQRARRARPADRRDRRRVPRTSRSTSTTSTRSSRAPTPTPSCAASCSRTCSTCSTAATRRRSSASCARGSPGTGSRARSARARARTSSPSSTPGTIPDRGLYAVTLPDGRRVGELDEEMVYEARPGQTFLLGATAWRIEEIGRDRVIVTPAPGAAGGGAVLEGRLARPPA